ncbi:unnamed protein product [Clonostachys rosea f. rosea IK726]|uniref:Glutaredoxin domain-containing protein n=2 Tax=Bionectria ochroleuca TaxID=29856 RepID=A0A0B7JKX5_BIOOC|nr:unnamed protein product [Clonostachys rosea f. rosea IK726]
MPSPRRIRLVGLAALVLTVFFLYYTSKVEGSARDRRGAVSFYDKTVNAMENKEKDTSGGKTVIDTKTGTKAGHIPADRDGDGDVDADDRESSLKMQERLKAAEQKAKEKANNKAPLRPDPPSDVVGVGSSAEGQDKKALSEDDEELGSNKKKTTSKPTKEDDAEAELNSILKKGPVIIFSKTYCPFSKRAKGLLLEKYSITPTPYVVELDEHPLGPDLQDALETLTGRRTVPNIMINGKSIGGADDIVALDSKDQLISKIVTLGSNRVTMTERFTAGE